jgi:hypothetical protein
MQGCCPCKPFQKQGRANNASDGTDMILCAECDRPSYALSCYRPRLGAVGAPRLAPPPRCQFGSRSAQCTESGAAAPEADAWVTLERERRPSPLALLGPS